MAKLEQRLKALERKVRLSAVEAVQAVQVQQETYSRAVNALRAALPDDRPQYSESGYTRRAIYPAGHQWHTDKLRALSARIAADAMTDQDREILDGLPAVDLGAVGLDGAGLVAMVISLDREY